VNLVGAVGWEEEKPWIYRIEKFVGTVERRRRPMVEVSRLAGGPTFLALVDTGAPSTICSMAFFEELSDELDGTPTMVAIGGKELPGIRSDLTVVVVSPSGGEGVQWTTEATVCTEWPNQWPWQMVLGQKGFFDFFTITFGSFGQEFALEPDLRFEERFGVGFSSGSERTPFHGLMRH
jgi:hypothetical protein